MSEGIRRFPASSLRPGRPGREMLRAAGSAPFLLLAGYVVLFALWALTSDLPDPERGFRSDLAFLPVGLAVTLLAWRASRAEGLDARTRRAWSFLTLAFFFFWLGDTIWFVSQWVFREQGTTGSTYLASQAAYIAYYPTLLHRTSVVSSLPADTRRGPSTSGSTSRRSSWAASCSSGRP